MKMNASSLLLNPIPLLVLALLSGCQSSGGASADGSSAERISRENENRISSLEENLRSLHGTIQGFRDTILRAQDSFNEKTRTLSELDTRLTKLGSTNATREELQESEGRQASQLSKVQKGLSSLETEVETRALELRNQVESQVENLRKQLLSSETGLEAASKERDALRKSLELERGRAVELAEILAAFLKEEKELTDLMGEAYYFIVASLRGGRPLDAKEFVASYSRPIDEKSEALKKRREKLEETLKNWRKQ